MKRILLFLMIGFIVPVGTSAQRVYLQGGKIILEMSAESEMPSGAQTTSPKTWVGIPDNTSTTPAMTGNLPGEKLNSTVYYKLQVAGGDITSDEKMHLDIRYTSERQAFEKIGMGWADAFNACKNTTYDGGGWRLPTQKELQMMWIFKEAIEDIMFNDLGYVDTYYSLGVYIQYHFSDTDYWSATENVTPTGVVSAYSVNFTTGAGPASDKTSTYRARCVREL